MWVRGSVDAQNPLLSVTFYSSLINLNWNLRLSIKTNLLMSKKKNIMYV